MIFYFVKDTKITNSADDNTPYKCGIDIDSILVQLESEGNMKANADKCYLLVTSNGENYSINLRGIRIDYSSEAKLLDILDENK